MTLSKSVREFHRKTATQSFNKTWEFLEMKERDSRAEQQMLNLAHTSRFHWSLVGSPTNLAVGDWQISRVYASLNHPHLALQYARSSLELSEQNRLSEIVSTAHEAMARAYALAKDYVSARTHIKKARTLLNKLSLDDEDREMYLRQLEETEALIRS